MKNKYILSCLIFLLAFNVGKTQTVLVAGDIAITGFNSRNTPYGEEFNFVILRDITAGTQIKLTDKGWFAAGGFRSAEGILTWTASTNLPCGTEVNINNTTNPPTPSVGTITETGTFGLRAGLGDEILVYQGPEVTPTFLYAIHFANANGWSDATDANNTGLPTGLTDGVNAVNFGNLNNGNYNCTAINGAAAILVDITQVANWTLSNAAFATLGGCGFTCCVATKTWSGIWTPAGLPTNTDEVVIDAPYDTAANGSFDACSLTVNADLNISGTNYVQVTNDITINNGDIIVASEANLVQISDASTVTLAGTGVGVHQKTTTPLQAYFSYTYWSSPFANETIGEAASGMDLVPSNRIFNYDATNFQDVAPVDGFDDDSNDWAVAAGAMIPGKGYAAFAQDNGMVFPQAQTFTFDGQFNNGIITTPVTVSAGLTDPNWNFLGNPYPSGLSADDFILNNPDLDGTVYLWTHNSDPLGANPGPDNLNFSVDDYASYTLGTGGVAAVTGGIAPTGVIASGQGFFVEGLNTGTATFKNSMRGTTGNENLFRATDRIWINLENDFGAFSQILIGFVEGATNGVDRLYDGKRLDAGSYISFFSVINDEHYAIQGREALAEEDIVPLGIKNDVPGENEYKISIDNVEGLLETSEIFLIDNLLNITHNLNSGPYIFNSEQGIFKERFELLLRPETLSTDDFSIAATEELIMTKNEDDSISFTTSNGVQIQNIQIFDVLGRQLFDENFSEEESPNSIKFDQIKRTIFIVKATLANGNVLTKKGLK